MNTEQHRATEATTRREVSLCERNAPVSGRYEGSRQSSTMVVSILELRVDVDPRSPDSPVLNKLSGDFFRQNFLPTGPLPPSTPARVYVESWIVEDPSAVWSDCRVTLVGEVKFYNRDQPATTIQVSIPWSQGTGIGPAEVTFTSVGGTPMTYSCALRSSDFREISFELDVCKSVNIEPLLPRYHAHWHHERPADLLDRELNMESAYADAGIRISMVGERTVIDDTAAAFHSWTSAELHDAMETHYSGYSGTWPAWRMWGLLAGLFEESSVGGVMFDAASINGGAGRAPERQGFAVFRRHSWFDYLKEGIPSDQREARAMRQYLYTFVHEAGHAFNFLHSWDKNRPDSLSWMNYDWRYDQANGSNAFWRGFRFRFDDDEVIHLRHGDRRSVIMGGDAWGAGEHLESPHLAYAQAEGFGPLELLLRAKPYFEFMEPVQIEARVRNRGESPIYIDPRLSPEYGAVVYFIQKIGAPVRGYHPLLCYLAQPNFHKLEGKHAQESGADRHSEAVSLTFGEGGFSFSEPGEYLIRAAYQSRGEILEPSNTLKIRIGFPKHVDDEKKACDFFSSEVGLNLYLNGSKSPFLRRGMDVIEEVQQQAGESELGIQLASVIAAQESRPFHRIEKGSLRQTHTEDPERSLTLTEPAVAKLEKSTQKSDNLLHRRITELRVGDWKKLDEPARAKAEREKLLEALQKRDANPVVLQELASKIRAGDDAIPKPKRSRRGS